MLGEFEFLDGQKAGPVSRGGMLSNEHYQRAIVCSPMPVAGSCDWYQLEPGPNVCCKVLNPTKRFQLSIVSVRHKYIRRMKGKQKVRSTVQ